MLFSRGKNHKGNVRGGNFNKEWENIKTGIFRDISQNVNISSHLSGNHLQRNTLLGFYHKGKHV